MPDPFLVCIRPEPFANDDEVAAAVARVRADVARLLATQGIYGDDLLDVPLRAVALDVLRADTGLEARVRVQWRDGCHCHPEYQERTLGAPTPEDLGRQLGACEHASEDDVGDAEWRMPLTGEERERAETAFREERARLRVRADRVAAHKLARAARDRARQAVASARAALHALRPELSPDALVVRESHLAELEAEEARAEQALRAAGDAVAESGETA